VFGSLMPSALIDVPAGVVPDTVAVRNIVGEVSLVGFILG